MMKVYLLYLAICSVHATYSSRITPMNRMRYATSFRPGVMLQKPWSYPRVVQMPSSRAPYMIYKNSPQRYTVKHYPTGIRSVFSSNPWKTTPRLPVSITEKDYINAASSPPLFTNGGTGAIHTIPAPNLSLSNKPIIVAEQTEKPQSVSSEPPIPMYQVSEKYSDVPAYQMPRIDTPIGFSKGNTFTAPEFQTLIRNGAMLQVSAEYNLPTVTMPQEFTIQRDNGLRPQHNVNNGASGLIIHPNPVFQTDPNLLQRIQNHILQTFPAVEFIPYTADVQLQPVKPEISTVQPLLQVTSEQPTESHIFLFDNDSVTKLTPTSFITSDTKNIVQRETKKETVAKAKADDVVIKEVKIEAPEPPKNIPNADDLITKQFQIMGLDQPRNITLDLIASDSMPITTTVKYVVENSTEDQKTTPLYFAQVGQTVNDVIANGFYSAINDVRAAAALAQIQKPHEDEDLQKDIATTKPEEHKTEFPEQDTNKITQTDKTTISPPIVEELKPVKIAYTLVRSDENEPKVTKDGAIYAGQIVEASISEDQEFHKEKTSVVSKRAPIRLMPITEDEQTTSTTAKPKFNIVKAKIPPKSKLTFDDKTGEPVLRIYASYADNLAQKEIVTAKLSNMKYVKPVTKNLNTVDNWNSAASQAADEASATSKLTEFGLKIKARSDDYEALFDDYE